MTSDPTSSNSQTEGSALEGELCSPRAAAGIGQVDEPNPQSAGDAAAEGSPEEQLGAEVARLKDQLLRMAADFDNFRKRSRREISDAERMAREDLLRELLPVFDNLGRASQHAGSATDARALVDGITMVNRQFVETLSRLGVERVQTVGAAFDPTVHEAVQQMETADQPPGMVCAEILAGYRFGERLIRPAMVVVAKAPASG